MRTILLGAVQSTEVALRALARTGVPPSLLLTLRPELAGRHSDYVELRPIADEFGVDVLEVRSAKSDEALQAVRAADADVLLVVGWSEILPACLLDTPRYGSLGYHPAPLPAMRGRAVIPWTVLLEQKQTAGTLFWLAPGLDDGDVAYQMWFGVEGRETATSLYAKHMAALAQMLEHFAASGGVEQIPRLPQDHAKATYCAQRKPVDGLIDWSQSAQSIERLIRATTDPYPGARALRERGLQEVCIWDADPVSAAFSAVPGQVVAVDPGGAVVACGSGFLRLCRVTDPGGATVELRVQDRFAPRAAAYVWWTWYRE